MKIPVHLIISEPKRRRQFNPVMYFGHKAGDYANHTWCHDNKQAVC